MIQVIQIVTGGWAVFIAVVLLICSFIIQNKLDRDIRTNTYIQLLIVLIIYQLTDMVAWNFSGDSSLLNYYMVRISNCICNIFLPIFLLVMGKFTILYVRTEESEAGKVLFRTMSGVTVIAVVFILINLFNKWMYYFDAENCYIPQKGPVTFIYSSICLGSMFLLHLFSWKHRKSKSAIVLQRVRTACLINEIAIPLQIWFFGYTAFSLSLTAGAVLLFTALLKERADQQIQKQLQLEENRKNLNLTRQQMLQLQIRPHFMYNTMAAIQALILEDQEKAYEAVGIFSTFLRDTINFSGMDHLITVEAELSFAEKFLELAELRFGDKLNIDFDIEATDFSVPPFTIQPLIENALNHGLKPFDHEGRICIRTRSEMLADRAMNIIEVEDNGIGIDTALLKSLPKKEMDHIGLVNVKERIEMALNGRLEVISPVEPLAGSDTDAHDTPSRKGTRIRISIPK